MIQKARDTKSANDKKKIDIPSPSRVSPVVSYLPSPVEYHDDRAFSLEGDVKRPSFQFYPEAWLADIALRAASSGARGLWIDMICLMHQGTPYGHLRLRNSNGGFFEPTHDELAKMTGNTLEDVDRWIAELDRIGVLGRKKTTIFSKKMVRDEVQRANWRKRQAKSRDNKDKDLPGNGVTQTVTPESRRSSSPSSSPTPTSKEKKGDLCADDPHKVPILMPNVFWEPERNDVVINEDWLKDELTDYTKEAGVTFSRKEYEQAKEDLRLLLLGDSRLRALLKKKDGKPSADSQFKRLATLTVGHFQRAIRNKAKFGKRGGASKEPKTMAVLRSYTNDAGGLSKK